MKPLNRVANRLADMPEWKGALLGIWVPLGMLVVIGLIIGLPLHWSIFGASGLLAAAWWASLS